MLESIRMMRNMTRQFGLSLRILLTLVTLNLFWIGFEGLGVALLLPIFEILRNGGDFQSAQLSSRYWGVIRVAASVSGIPITLVTLLALSFSFLILRQFFNYLNVYYHSVTARRGADSIRRRIFNGFLRAEGEVQDEIRPGELANDLTVELGRAQSSIFSAVRGFGVAVQMSVYVVGLFLLSPALTTLAIAAFGLIALLVRKLMARVKKTGAAITKANAELAAFVVERLPLARLVRLSGTERAEAAAFANLSRNQVQKYINQTLIMTRMTLIPEPVAIGSGYLVLLVGGQFLGISIARLGLFMVILIRLMPVVNNAVSNFNNIVGQWPSVLKVNNLLVRLRDARAPKGGSILFRRVEQALSYDRVSFSYESGEIPALRDVTVKIPAHRMTALVGPSGAGKSTFIDLLPRLRDPTSGEIRVDGVPLTEFTTESLRKGIAFVPQQPQIFNISAAEHIRYGKEDATDAEVVEAARLAGALVFIERLPQGFETLLGDGGKQLSGGQRQRLDIARAIVRRAPILILDEPTSALDAEAEFAFRDALATLRAETDLTIIVIAHRLSTIGGADQIVVLQQGRVTAVGTHEQLIAAGGWYAEAHRLQRGMIDVLSPRAQVPSAS
jgi:subfamily B ATP-binding cassette protein MsbA